MADIDGLDSRLVRDCMKGPFVVIETEKLFPGIGPKSIDMLRIAGITSAAQLRAIGAVAAYVLVERANCRPSLNLLWGLESAITGEHWRDVAKNHRMSLLLALEEAREGPKALQHQPR